MTGTNLFAALLLSPLVAVSGAAYAGPSNYVPPRVLASATNAASTAYAQYMPMKHSDGYQCIYEGGPKSSSWHVIRP